MIEHRGPAVVRLVVPPAGRGSRRLRSPVAAVLVAVMAGIIGAPGGTAAAAANWPVTADTVLPGVPIQALAADLDNDGAREIVRLIVADEDPYLVSLDVWRAAGLGWSRVGEPRPVTRIPTLDELRFLRRGVLDERGLLPIGVGEPARLIASRFAGRERVVVASSANGDRWWVPCCLTLQAVELTTDAVEVSLLTRDVMSADAVLAADLDADGTDELVVGEPAQPTWTRSATARPRLRAYRWEDGGVVRLARIDVPGATGPPFRLGETDGRPGDELGYLEMDGGGALLRASLSAGGELALDRAELGMLATSTLQAAALPGGEPDLVVVGAAETQRIVWPSGSAPYRVAHTDLGGELLGTLGAGPCARVLINDLASGALWTVDSDLRHRAAPPPAEEPVRATETPLPPYRGELPGGLADASPAVVHRGRLFTVSACDGTLARAEVSMLAGAVPLGLVGTGGRSIALLHSVASDAQRVDRHGGSLAATTQLPGAWISVPPTELVLGPARQPAVAVTSVEGGVVESMSGDLTVTTGPSGFALELASPPGSRVMLLLNERPVTPEDPLVVGDSGRLTVPIRGALLPDGDGPFRAELVIATPSGRAVAISGTVRIQRHPPRLDVSAPFASLSNAVEISGSTDLAAAVRVDGRPVEVDEQGRFSVVVPGGIWPSDVEIEAFDRVGNRASRTVSVVAPVDYRRIPWLPVVVAATVIAAAAMVWRPGRLLGSQRASPGAGADGTLEELEG